MGSPTQLQNTVITLYAISCVTVALRCFVRARIVKSFKYDDWLMVATWAIFSIYTSCVLQGVHYGTGQHIQDLTPANALIAKRYWYLCELTYILNTTLIKLAIASFLLRIAVAQWHIRGLKIVIGVAGLFGFFYLFFGIFQCWPISKFWLPDEPGWCFSGTQIAISSYAHSTISAAADWYCGILPIFMVRQIRLSKRMKVVVAGILGVGSIGSVASIVRYKYIEGFQTDDFLFSTTDLAIWSTIEVGLGIIAGSMATFRPLLRILFGKAKTLRTTGYGSNPSATGAAQAARNGSIPLSAPYARTAESQKDLVKDAWSPSILETEIEGPQNLQHGDFGSRHNCASQEGVTTTIEGGRRKNTNAAFVAVPMTMPKAAWKARRKEDSIV